MKILSSFYNKNNNNIGSDPFSIKEGSFHDGVLKNSSLRRQWTENSFDPSVGKKDTIGRNFNFNKIYLLAVILIFFISILFGRTAWLQVVKGDYYYMMAEGNRIREERIEPKRGIIYDRNGNTLVRNKANFVLYFIPIDLPRDDIKIQDDIKIKVVSSERMEIFKRISEITDKISLEELENIYSSVTIGSFESYRPLFVADGIDYEKAIKLYLEADRMPGVVVSNKIKREYNLYSMTLSHILGYTGIISREELDSSSDEYSPIDYIGKMGVEYFWENELKGINGKKQIEVDALGYEKKIISKTEAEDGHNLVLSLDIVMQKKMEEIIISYLEKLSLGKASAVILNPNNGEVLTLVSYPSYNNNAFARGITQEEYSSLLEHPDNPLFNRAVSGEFPSGSTIKPVMAAAALQEGVITEKTSFLSTGGVSIGQWYFPDWRAGGHGITDVRKAISQSVNTFFYYIGGGDNNNFQGLGLERIIEYEEKFGLGAQTGIDLAGEADGFLPTREWKEEVKEEPWYIGDTYHLSIGQGDLLVTPLQVVNFISFFANGGTMYRPHLIKQILDGDDVILADVKGEAVRDGFIDNYNVQVVRQGMRETVTEGSARSLSNLPVTSAGKTGTAQWSSVKDNHAWYTGFAPYENPELAFVVLVEEGVEGSAVSVPIMREFLEWYYKEYKPIEE
ncbi:MAG: penicillin-binding protein 2 [Patescibacteria group bacterium]|jgi:penicillin-binding protein 2|nr:penicillin-binding protein 2 [Patescibacteria group bacterium]